MRRWCAAFILLFVLSGVACAQQVILAPTVPTAASIVVTAVPATLTVGGTSVLSAQMYDTNGQPNIIVTQSCAWSSSNAAVIAVSTSGTATGMANGSAIISCAYGGMIGSVTLTITTPVITNPPVCGAPPCALPPATQSSAYSFLLGASGGTPPYTWTISVGALPTGLSLSSTSCGTAVNCNIQGTPSGTGINAFTITVTDAAAANASLQVSLTVNAGASCGPPTYPCSIQGPATALAIIQQPATPNMGNLTGVNTIVTPTDFNNPIVRCTDINTSSLSFTSHSYDVTDSGGGFDMIWNSNDTLLAVVETNTGKGTVLGFNPATMQCTAGQPTLQITTGRAWSRTNPNLLRTMATATSTLLQDYTFNYLSPSTAPVVTGEFNFGTCNGMGPITPTWNASVTTSTNDAIVATGFSATGGQNTGIYVAAYHPATGECDIWNTNTGAITGSNGGVTGTATTNFPFNIHDVTIWPGGWIEVGVGTTCTGCPSPHGPFFWQAGTLNTTLSTANSGGHNAGGTTNWYNISTAPRLCQRPFSNPTTCTFVNDITGISIGTLPSSNSHVTWQEENPSETTPIFMSHSAVPQPAAYGALYTSPLQNEIFGAFVNNPPTGSFVRIAHTFTTGYNNPPINNFRTYDAISATSQTGKFIAFASDWMGTLGNIDGVTTTCVPGGWPWKAGFGYAVTYEILPNTSPNNAGKFVFKATTGGISGATEPTWPQTLNSTVTDGTVTWKNVGLPNCRNDVFVVKPQ